jgi:VanZ family protein
MNDKTQSVVYLRIVQALCICIVCGILCAGLWPFHSPANQVRWLEKENGVLFGSYGTIVSTGQFRANPSSGGESGSLELWVEPQRLDSKRTILSFDESQHLGSPFSLRQNKDGLIVTRYNIDDRGVVRTAWFGVKSIFRENKRVFVTVNVGPRDTSVYVDGSLAAATAVLGNSDNNLTGRLLLANSPRANDSWSGRILGLAIYGRPLTPAEVMQHYANWTKNQQPLIAAGEAPTGFYLFNEGGGNIVRNQLDPATNLDIPAQYLVLHPLLLSSVRRDYKPTWGYWKDVGVNIAGFIPLGFCVLAYLASVLSIKRAVVTTVALGFAISMTIEVLQSFLPTRSSGMTDIITNTLGTAIGVELYRWSFTQRLLAWINLGLVTPCGSEANSPLAIAASQARIVPDSEPAFSRVSDKETAFY